MKSSAKYVRKPYKRLNTGKELSRELELFKPAYTEIYKAVTSHIKSGNKLKLSGLNIIKGLAAKIVWLYLRENKQYKLAYENFLLIPEENHQIESGQEIMDFFGFSSEELVDPMIVSAPDDLVF